ncbi:hypothetical protein [Streptomyces sp. NPDC059786]|uniref:hypothetical protein n=1 Tax=Streptomyces sp. NPDC059786 TaxID=3346946 RepID=UPI00364EA8FD
MKRTLPGVLCLALVLVTAGCDSDPGADEAPDGRRTAAEGRVKTCPPPDRLEKDATGAQVADTSISRSLCVDDYIALEKRTGFSDFSDFEYLLGRTTRSGKLELSLPEDPHNPWQQRMVSCLNLDLRRAPGAVQEFFGCRGWGEGATAEQRKVAKAAERWYRAVGELNATLTTHEDPADRLCRLYTRGSQHAFAQAESGDLGGGLTDADVSGSGLSGSGLSGSGLNGSGPGGSCPGMMAAFWEASPWLAARQPAVKKAVIDPRLVQVSGRRAAVHPDAYSVDPAVPIADNSPNGRKWAECRNAELSDGILFFRREENRWKLDTVVSKSRGSGSTCGDAGNPETTPSPTGSH